LLFSLSWIVKLLEYTTIGDKTMTNQINNADVTFNVGKIKVTVHAPSIKTTDEENKRQLAQYLYKLVEMDNKAM